MRISLNHLCNKRLDTKPNDHAYSNELKKKKSDPQLWRDILAYWILGLSSEFGYVVIISAAHDILHGFDNNSTHDQPAESHATADSVTNIRQSVCSAPSTGVMLIADIVPSVLMNISCPFLPLVKNFRMGLVVVLNVTSFLLILNSNAEYVAIIGVVCTSLALGIGEVTLLSYSARFNKKVITASVQPKCEEKFSGVKAKLKFVPKLAGFITPLVIVFIFEYICVSGLFEMLHVRDAWLPPSSQYRWFLVIYQIGVFSSRTLGALIQPRRTWWATIVQFANACGFLYMASAANIPSAWIVFMLVFGLGAVGGVCYVHTFHRLVEELPSNRHKFSLGMIIISESIGIAIAGFTAIPLHNIICGKAIIS